MRVQSVSKQAEMLRANITSRMQTLGNTLFRLTPENVKMLDVLLQEHTADCIYSSFYAWSELPHSKHERNLNSFKMEPEQYTTYEEGLKQFEALKQMFLKV